MDEKAFIRRYKTSNLLIGLLLIAFSILAIMYPEATINSLAFLLSVALMIIGIARVLNASSDENLKNIKVIARFLSGAIAVIISFVAMLLIISDPETALDLWYILLAIGILIIGLARIILGIQAKEYDKWFKIYLIVIGLLLIVLSILVIVIPDLGDPVIIVMIALTLILNGITKIILGILGPK